MKKNLLVKITLTTALLFVVLLQFSCSKDSNSNTTAPTVLTNSILAEVTTTTATSGGTISDGGSSVITTVGVCYSTTSQTPTISDTHTTDTLSSASFVSKLTGLTAGTTYYVRSYATNGAGTGYGGVVKFTTSTPSTVTSATVSTFVGSATGGLVNGTGTAAQLYNPLGIATDAQGNIYVADQFNHVIRKITTAGVVSTFCGSGVNGHADGPAATAAFSSPNALTVDKSGNVFVTDQVSNLVIKITPDGTATTVAGIGAPGYANSSSPLKAAFNNPKGIAVDATGNIYIADSGNNRIRKIGTDGVVSTLAGSGYTTLVDGTTGTAANFNNPNGLAFDSKGDLYVCDNNNHAIRKIVLSTTAVTTFIGNSLQTKLVGNPGAIVFDNNDNLFITDVVGRVLRFSSTTNILQDLAGTSGVYGFADGVGTAAQFNSPSGVAVVSGTIYVSDANNNRIRKVVTEN
ncbi:NHL repeat-containing protein [Mucilaginibacter agri]|uniref:Fibronectin type-III domain-containing protein n=1 Tax=Mucilaginibacter agri TaxID=2695265 RepID=A0A965ZHA8_9SPHI|nr:NHL repeat-containing protein [Mucilaginibacter agri]NCD69651.1 hypothetical protein [Mucilaginibacter agri]